jgi:hypothetical protein
MHLRKKEKNLPPLPTAAAFAAGGEVKALQATVSGGTWQGNGP